MPVLGIVAVRKNLELIMLKALTLFSEAED